MNTKYNLFLCFLTIFILAGAVSGASDSDGLTVYAGATVYNDPAFDSVALLDVSFSLKRHELDFYRIHPDSELVESRVLALLKVTNSLGQSVDSVVTYFSVRAENQQAAAERGISLFNKLSLLLKPGFYSAALSVIDAVSRRRGEYLLSSIEVGLARQDSLTISGVQWAYDIEFVGDSTQGVNPRMVRNGLNILPCPKSIFGTEDSVVFMYAEVYNLVRATESAGQFFVTYSILDESRQIYQNYGGVLYDKPGRSAVVSQSFDIKGWPQALYWLHLTALDRESGIADTLVSPFRIVSARELQARFDETHKLDPYDTLGLKARTSLVEYMLTPDQKRTLSGLSNLGKDNYLNQFWAERERKNRQEGYEFRKELMARFEYCNHRFSFNAERDNGWLTARGRIYMKYGEYDKIYDVQAPLIGNPYQVWYYFGIGQGQYFVFEDPHGDDDYRLVHSNATTEIHSMEWQKKINEGTIDVIGF